MMTFWKSPMGARVAPYLIFLGLTMLQGAWGESSRYWLYLAKTLVGAWLVWRTWDAVSEMRWAVSGEAVAVGIGVFVVWVGLDPFVPGLSELFVKLGLSKPAAPEPHWNPNLVFGDRSVLAWFFVVVRILGSSLVVPPIEEVFFRSFLYRYIVNPAFESVALNVRNGLALAATSAVFGFAHQEWLAGIVCAVAYQALVLRKNRLGDAMTAHAITNALLGVWVVARNDWKFW